MSRSTSLPLPTTLFILLPPFISVALVFFFTHLNIAPQIISPWTWLILVVFIDVSHVWSTVFRTYFSKRGRRKYKDSLWIVPLVCYLMGVVLYSFGPLIFWRTLAYFALFHFIRQQYGLFRLYEEDVDHSKGKRVLNQIVIYSCSVIPIFIWHLSGPQKFWWFIPQDFYLLESPIGVSILKILGPTILSCYLIREFIDKSLWSLKNAVVLGTYLAWWTGIVWVPTDWSFTLTNVLSHGIPYFALINYLHFSHGPSSQKEDLIWPKKLPLLMAILFVFGIGFLEEGLWDILMWRDHPLFFGKFYFVRTLGTLSLQALVIPLLALPQATHYALDGLIWKKNKV